MVWPQIGPADQEHCLLCFIYVGSMLNSPADPLTGTSLLLFKIQQWYPLTINSCSRRETRTCICPSLAILIRGHLQPMYSWVSHRAHSPWTFAVLGIYKRLSRIHKTSGCQSVRRWLSPLQTHLHKRRLLSFSKTYQSKTWQMKFHTDDIKICTSKWRLINTSYQIQKHTLDMVDSRKYLGVTISDDLT